MSMHEETNTTEAHTTASWRAALAVLVAVVATVTVVAMTASHGEPDPSVPPMAVDADDAAEHVAAITDVAPVAQRAQLDDGVTLDEYRTAVEDAVGCLRDAFAALAVTADVSSPELSADGYEYTYRYRIGPRPDGSVLLPNVVSTYDQTCRAAHLDATESVYQLGLRSTEGFTDSVDDLFTSCLHDAGVEAPDEGDPRDVAVGAATQTDTGAAAAAEACIAAHPSITDVLPSEADAFAGATP